MLHSGQSERHTCNSWKILGYNSCVLNLKYNLKVIFVAIIISIRVYVYFSMCVHAYNLMFMYLFPARLSWVFIAVSGFSLVVASGVTL